MTIKDELAKESTESVIEKPSEPRFAFGKNWARFLEGLDEARIISATESFRQLLGGESLEGKSVLDVGSGSGLFSLAACRLGADTVHSFDYDADSVRCARWLKKHFDVTKPPWVIEQGDILDQKYLENLGTFDIVYSWGVLHHTGEMWRALDNISRLVRPGGKLIIALYNDQGWISTYWLLIKRLYNSGLAGRALSRAVFIPYFLAGSFLKDLIHLKNPLQRYRPSSNRRGMSMLIDCEDWLGGYPFEVAKPQTVVEFYRAKGFSCERVIAVGNKMGCNEFVLQRL